MFSFEQRPRFKRPFTIGKVYRVLYRRAAADGITMEYHDAVMPEHRCKARPNVESGPITQRHVCSELCCPDAVRLIPVGCEDVLDKFVEWWQLHSRTENMNLSSVLVEQESYLAQEQVRAGGFTPIFLYDYLQFMVTDMPVKQYEKDGEVVWALL